MNRQQEKDWDNDLEDMKIKAELLRISEKIDRIVKTFETNDPAAKSEQHRNSNEN